MTRAVPPRQREHRVYGRAAALAAYRARPETVFRVLHTELVRHELAEILRDAARRRIAYREVTEDELARASGSVHHEGVCVFLRARDAADTPRASRELEPNDIIVALDGVTNPHNLGAIVRSAAFFGVRAILVESDDPDFAVSAAAARVAEGGAEHVRVVAIPDLAAELTKLHRRGAFIIGADERGRTEAHIAINRVKGALVLVLGAERDGLRRTVREACNQIARIDGSGNVSSLNVSVACGVLLAFARARESAE